MSDNVVKFEDTRQLRDQARETASGYLSRLDAGATPDDLHEIEAWLAEHAINREVFLEMAALWDNLGVLSRLSEVFPLAEYSPARGGARAGHRRTLSWTLAAACSLFLLAGGWFVGSRLDTGGMSEQDDTRLNRHYVTRIGGRETIALPDGSEIILNTDSELDIVWSSSARNIFLPRGEGYFKVEPDPDRPFRVYAGERMVEAVGTSFVVEHTQANSVEVVVREGRVNFYRVNGPQMPDSLPGDISGILLPDERIALDAGERASVPAGSSMRVEKLQIEPADLEIALSWTTGMLQFQGETLSEVVREINRYTTVRIDMVDSVRSIEVSGYFTPGDIEAFKVAMKENFNIEAMQLGENSILLYPEE